MSTYPDAVMFEQGWRPSGKTTMDECLDWCEEVLGKPEHGKQIYWRTSGRTVLVTLHLHDCLDHHNGHPEAGTPRYDWVGMPTGCHFGTLKPSAWVGDLTDNQREIHLEATKEKLQKEQVAKAAKIRALQSKADLSEDDARELDDLTKWNEWVNTFCQE